MAMGPFKSLNANYFQLGNNNDSTCDDAVYVRVTNISSSNAYDVKLRTTANNDGTNVGRTIIAPGESFILKKATSEFVHGASGNIYASPISPRE